MNNFGQMSTTDFPTSEELYSRIKYDPRLSAQQFIIVHYDRLLDKNIEVPLIEWIPIKYGGNIPWHRVHQFKYKHKFLHADIVVWDRATRMFDLTKIAANDTACESVITNEISVLTFNIIGLNNS